MEQDFNSLDAQREACAAFINSQKHEGWVAVSGVYEDGGFSGGNMERPGLRRLMEDIRAGKVDIIVVYKIDRLTRSLADFAKMVEVFDSHKVSFVSVTQQFNTTTSMGRLTLNVLLSFAQFEREISAERIRDKFAASRAKGMWMGGTVPLGYRVHDRQLLENPLESALVRSMFQRYLEVGSIDKLRDSLNREGVRTRSGKMFGTGMLAKLLTNPVYIGKAVHKGKVYEGRHVGIIDPDLWEKVQVMRMESKVRFRHQLRAVEPSLLAGKLFDAEGNPMSPIHAKTTGRRYRYYVSQAMLRGLPVGDETLTRIPSAEVEKVVAEAVWGILGNDQQLSQIMPDISLFQRKVARGNFERWERMARAERQVIIRTALSRIIIGFEDVRLAVSRVGLAKILEGKDHVTKPGNDDYSLLIPIKVKPVAGGGVTIIPNGEVEQTRVANRELVRAVAHAYVGNRLLMNREVGGQAELAKRFGMDERRIRELLPLAWLAPDIVEMVMAGRQPVDLTIGKLMAIARHGDWAEQRKSLHHS